MEIIKVNNIIYSYDKNKPFIQNLSFSVEEGSYLSIIGHNGSGKSTIAKILDGLLPLQGGEVIIDGLTLEEKNLKEIRKKIAIVFQNPDNQFIGATVEDDVAFGLENRNIPRKEMIDLVEQFLSNVGMKDKVDCEPSALSGGQKQRVAIAGALVLNPQILILDEATAMLDPKGKSDIQKLILKLKQMNPKLTIISITHNIEETYFSDQIMFLDQGQIIYQGSPIEFYKNTEFLEKFHIKTPFIYQFRDLLISQNIKIKETNSLEEMSDLLCRLK